MKSNAIKIFAIVLIIAVLVPSVFLSSGCWLDDLFKKAPEPLTINSQGGNQSWEIGAEQAITTKLTVEEEGGYVIGVISNVTADKFDFEIDGDGAYFWCEFVPKDFNKQKGQLLWLKKGEYKLKIENKSGSKETFDALAFGEIIEQDATIPSGDHSTVTPVKSPTMGAIVTLDSNYHKEGDWGSYGVHKIKIVNNGKDPVLAWVEIKNSEGKFVSAAEAGYTDIGQGEKADSAVIPAGKDAEIVFFYETETRVSIMNVTNNYSVNVNVTFAQYRQAKDFDGTQSYYWYPTKQYNPDWLRHRNIYDAGFYLTADDAATLYGLYTKATAAQKFEFLTGQNLITTILKEIDEIINKADKEYFKKLGVKNYQTYTKEYATTVVHKFFKAVIEKFPRYLYEVIDIVSLNSSFQSELSAVVDAGKPARILFSHQKVDQDMYDYDIQVDAINSGKRYTPYMVAGKFCKIEDATLCRCGNC